MRKRRQKGETKNELDTEGKKGKKYKNIHLIIIYTYMKPSTEIEDDSRDWERPNPIQPTPSDGWIGVLFPIFPFSHSHGLLDSDACVSECVCVCVCGSGTGNRAASAFACHTSRGNRTTKSNRRPSFTENCWIKAPQHPTITAGWPFVKPDCFTFFVQKFRP